MMHAEKFWMQLSERGKNRCQLRWDNIAPIALVVVINLVIMIPQLQKEAIEKAVLSRPSSARWRVLREDKRGIIDRNDSVPLPMWCFSGSFGTIRFVPSGICARDCVAHATMLYTFSQLQMFLYEFTFSGTGNFVLECVNWYKNICNFIVGAISAQ